MVGGAGGDMAATAIDPAGITARIMQGRAAASVTATPAIDDPVAVFRRVEDGISVKTKLLGYVDKGMAGLDSNGLIDSVGGKPVKEFLADLSVERRGLYQDARTSGVLSRNAQGEVVSLAIDLRTGAIYEGLNGREGYNVLPQAEWHQTLTDNWNAPWEPGTSPHPSPPMSHAEVKAVNQALWDRTALGLPVGQDGLGEILISPDFTFKDGGTPAPACSNCTHTLAGVQSLTPMLTTFPGADDANGPVH
jgi:hypothetical protein